MAYGVTTVRSRERLVCHICSRCGFPVTNTLSISGTGTSYSYSFGSAEERADGRSYESIYNTIDGINSIKTYIRRIKTLSQGRAMEYINEIPSYSYIAGYSAACPYCGNVEPWQYKKISTEIMSINEENAPEIFTNEYAIVKWINKSIDNIVQKVETKRTPDGINEAKKNVVALLKQKNSLENQLNELCELKKLLMLESELKRDKSLKEDTGLFNIKNRAKLNSEIKSIKKEIEITKQIVLEKKKPIELKLNKCNRDLFINQGIAYGLIAETKEKQLDGACCYYIKANSIPLNDLPKEEKSAPKKEHIAEKKNKAIDEVYYCKKCGYKLKPDSVFCSRCGERVD